MQGRFPRLPTSWRPSLAEQWPGRYRPGDIHIDEAHTGRRVYTGPDADDVPSLISELIDWLADGEPETSLLVRASMAYLNLAGREAQRTEMAADVRQPDRQWLIDEQTQHAAAGVRVTDMVLLGDGHSVGDELDEAAVRSGTCVGSSFRRNASSSPAVRSMCTSANPRLHREFGQGFVWVRVNQVEGVGDLLLPSVDLLDSPLGGAIGAAFRRTVPSDMSRRPSNSRLSGGSTVR
ncbi:hypothetical protein ACLQ29_35250 [Micromonospora sp. DT228]|uniref:hypothetical protein n=1 Tax=Micromonospora sp. DT228 TaxID=3393443 RepID=UPI003CE700B9